MTRHESDLKDNNYCLGLITHMQNPLVPNKNVDCLRDLLTMYQTASLEDVFTAYRHLGLTDDAVFTCVGTSGREPPPPPNAEKLRQLYGVSAWPGAVAGRGAAAANGSSGSSSSSGDGMGVPGGDPLAMFAAMIAAAQASNISKAFNMLGSQQQQGQGEQQQQQEGQQDQQ